MFKRDHHNRIASVLQSLDADLLREHQCYFGGGTAIVLARDEYRESIDIDFLISDISRYGEIRQLIKSKGLSAIFRSGISFQSVREPVIDQYGIRTMLKVGDAEIKFEIVSEGRVQLELPSSDDRICGVSTLSPLDMATTKLLANSDSWYDTSVHSRDLIP